MFYVLSCEFGFDLVQFMVSYGKVAKASSLQVNRL